MKREHDLERRVDSLDALAKAIGAVKSLSAHHFRETRAEVEPVRRYRAGVDRVVARTGAVLPAGDGAAGLLLIGGELGLCGPYNSTVVASALERRRELGEGPTFCVGRRACSLLARRGLVAERSYSGPTSVRGLTDLLLGLADEMLGAYVEQRLSCFEVVASRFEGVGSSHPTTTRLLPVERVAVEGSPPTRYVSLERLQSAAVRELLYITIYGLLLEALASEHGARLVATQAAEGWLNERTAVLRRRLSSARRESSTQEVIEIVAGARARRRLR